MALHNNLITIPEYTGLVPVEDLTRREFMASALAAALLIACSDDEPENDAATTRAFTDSMGRTVQVPMIPQRIVALHDSSAGGQVLALGGPLVGMSQRNGVFTPVVARDFDLSGVSPIRNWGALDREAVVALNPDLLVTFGAVGQGTLSLDLDEWSEIAPVVAINSGAPVGELMQVYADLLGDAVTVDLAGQRAEFEAMIDQLRELLGEAWGAVTVGYIQQGPDGTLYARGPVNLPQTQILDALGVTWSAANTEAGGSGGYLVMSPERMRDFSGDLIVADVTFERRVLTDPLFEALPAVQAGQVLEYTFESGVNHYSYNTAVARTLLEGLRPLMPVRTDIV